MITGGAGFIGSNVARRWAGQGRNVAISDFPASWAWGNLEGVPIACSIEPEALPCWLADHRHEVEAIVHLGAISSTLEADTSRLVSTNVRLSQWLWTWCEQAGVPFVYASSAATYGDGTFGFDDRAARDRLWRMRPLNAYGRSKHLFDLWASGRAERAAPPFWAGLKFFNVYGPGEAHKGPMRSVALQLHEAARAGEPARLFRSYRSEFPDGGQMRDFVHVGDCVDAIDWLLRAQPPSGLYNIGTGVARSFLDVAGAVFQTLGRPPAVEFVAMPGEVRRHYQYRTCAEMTRLREAGCPVDFRSIEQGIEDYFGMAGEAVRQERRSGAA